MTFSTLRALHAAIGTAIDDIERVYRDRSQGTPLEYPSLDEAYYYTAQHTPEEELAEMLKDDPAVLMASMRIVGACGQLSITVNKPWFGLMENAMRGQFSAAIRFLETANIVEILREAGPGGLHVQEIHRQIFELRTNLKSASPVDKTPLTPESLSHILRLLATGHYLREVTPDVFANNRASSYIDTGKTVAQLRKAPEMKYHDTDGVAAFVAMVADEGLMMIPSLTDWALPNEKRAPSTHSDTRAPAGGPPQEKAQAAEDGGERAVERYVAPFNLAFDTQLGYFQWLELPENEGRFVRFGHSMAGWRQCELKDQIVRAFAWETLPQGAVLVDVGGGIGAQSVLVAQAHPHIRVVVEDREQVVSTAPSSWGPQYAPLLESGRMSWRTRDFFEPWVPLALPAPGGVDAAPDVFFLRMILHDWNDEDCRRILRRLRAAAGPHTKLLTGDMMLQHACADAAAYDGADGSGKTFPFVTKDSPLLPNLGLGNSLGYLLDILMLGLFDAKERTVAEMGALLLSTGWKIEEVRRMPGSLWAYTTAIPV